MPVHNGLHFLKPMLESLRAHTNSEDYELILSDDASSEETKTFIKAQDAKVISSEANRGFAATCNAGAKIAIAEFLVFLNTDLEFRAGWLETLVQVADGDQKIGAVGCKLLYPDGTIQHGGVFLREDQLDRIPLVASHDHVGKPGNDPEANKKTDLVAVTAAAIFIRKAAFEEVGGFDEEYINGYEDVDLCLKLKHRGWRVVYEPACEIVHHESKSGSKRFAHSKANQRRFVDQWLGRVTPEVLVTPHLEVEPHPGTMVEKPKSVRIVVPVHGQIAAAAQTLESILTARIGLDDKVIALVDSNDQDAKTYMELCEGYDDAFKWCEEMDEVTEDFLAAVTPGTIVTQGWLSRLTAYLEREDIDVVGPLMTEVHGPQEAFSYLGHATTGAFFPNELSHAFARSFQGEAQIVDRLEEHCLVMKTGADLANARKAIAKDVFVHRDSRFVKLSDRLARQQAA